MIHLWKNTEDVLDYASQNEADSAARYGEMAEQASTEELGDLFRRLAVQEKRHQLKLMKMKEAKELSLVESQISELELELQPDKSKVANMTREDAWAFALKAENDAETLYTMLSEMVRDPAVAAVL